jgi:transcription elongation factor Elf1
MSLTKFETICPDCGKHYILVVKQKDIKFVTCCPFCGSETAVAEPEEEV